MTPAQQVEELRRDEFNIGLLSMLWSSIELLGVIVSGR